MPTVGLFKAISISLVLALTLSACKSSEERAEEYYQSGLELAEGGDYDRAIVELRNVFEFDGSHRDARFLLANILLDEKNNPRGAYGQYLRLAEQYPDDAETRIMLSELAFRGTNWEELERHGTKAIELAADQPRVQVIATALAYRTAALAEDAPARREQARAAESLMTQMPESLILRQLVLDTKLQDGAFDEAMVQLEWLLEREPENVIYWRQRLNILAQLNDLEGVQQQLLDMVDRFPDDIEHKQRLLSFYISRGQTDEAEAFLRQTADAAAQGETGPRADLINYLLQVRGPEAALTEIESAIANSENPTPFRVLRATVAFGQGAPEDAVAELEDVLETAEPSEQTNSIKIALARMLLSMNNEVGARAQIEEVLAADEGQPEALKMQAAWQIRADQADEAINNLRNALDRAPDDAQAMTLMAEAYSRSGRPQLSQDFLALAVDASGNAPAESLRYARVLVDQERYLPAEDILIPALRLQPQNVALLSALGSLYLSMEDMGRAQQVVDTLGNMETPEAQQAHRRLEAQWISANNGVEEAVAYLEKLAGSADASLGNQVELVRARLATGDVDAALALTRELIAENPDNQSLNAILGTVEAASGNFDEAIAIYRDVLTTNSQSPAVWQELARVTQRAQGGDAAQAIIEEALVAVPEDANLLWANASYKERTGDIDGAIEIYEGLYVRNSGSVVIANNLASMLSTYRADDASLDRAWTVARRFRDTDIPAMQDTFGWILHRRGESGEALPYLESAAQGLPNDPIVQFHLGQVYTALDRGDDALAQYRRAVQIAGPGDTREQIVEARAKIEAAEQAAEN